MLCRWQSERRVGRWLVNKSHEDEVHSVLLCQSRRTLGSGDVEKRSWLSRRRLQNR